VKEGAFRINTAGDIEKNDIFFSALIIRFSFSFFFPCVEDFSASEVPALSVPSDFSSHIRFHVWGPFAIKSPHIFSLQQ